MQLREEVWPFFKRCSASDEMYFPTCLALLGEITAAALSSSSSSSSAAPSSQPPSEPQEGLFASDSVAKRRLTFCRWGDSPKSPEAFDAFDAGVLAAAVGEGCLFARKFKPGAVELSAWLAHMRGMEEEKGVRGSAAYGADAGFAALTLEDGEGGGKRNGAKGEEGPRKRARQEEGAEGNGRDGSGDQ